MVALPRRQWIVTLESGEQFTIEAARGHQAADKIRRRLMKKRNVKYLNVVSSKPVDGEQRPHKWI